MEPTLPISQRHEFKKTRTKVFSLSNETLFILGSISFAFLIRLFLFPQNTVINGDGVYYASLGGKIIAGNFSEGISTYWSPLYPFLIGLASVLFHDLEFAGRFISIIAGTLLIVPAYFLIVNFYGRKAAYFGTVLIVVHPFLVTSSVWVMTESLYTLIFTTAVLTGWLALRVTGEENNIRRKQNFFLTGLLLGMAYLTKPEAVGFVILFFILTFSAKFFRRNLSFRSLAVGFSLCLLGFAIFSLPYIIYVHEKTERWMISKKLLSNFSSFDGKTDDDLDKSWLSLTSDGQMTMRDKFFADDYEVKNQSLTTRPTTVSESTNPPREGFDYGKFLSNVYNNIKKQLVEYVRYILPYPFLFLIAIGFFYKTLTRLRLEREIYLLAFVICTLVGYALAVIELRYLFALIPIFLAWTARGIIGFGELTSKLASGLGKPDWNINPLLLQLFVSFILLISLIPLFASQITFNEWQNVPFEEKEAGLWIKSHSNPSPLVMSSSAVVSFYADGRHTFLPDESFATVMDYAKRKNVDYVVYDQRRLKSTPNAFPDEMQNYRTELKLVFQDEPSPGYQIFIYQLQK